MIINQDVYNGDLIHERFAFKYFKNKVNPSGNIVAFRAPMEVTLNLIDLEDSLNKDYIYSEDAINFCWEIPNLCPVGAVAFQRLFNLYISNILYKYVQKPIEVDGDDLIVKDEQIPPTSKFPDGGKGKCSVSITYSKDNIAIGHTGINIFVGKKGPDFAYSTNLDEKQAQEFIDEVLQLFYFITHDLFAATTKVIV